MSEKRLVLIRGISGSGKSTTAKELVEEFTQKGFSCRHFETDQFFTDMDGNYHFNKEDLQRAHSWCLNETKLAMAIGVDLIVVSNTFTKYWEMAEYMLLTKKHSEYVVDVIEKTQYYKSEKDSIDVTVLQAQKDRFQEYFKQK